MRALRLDLAALLLAAACTVPNLGDLGAKRCDLDAGHACIQGYECVQGSCTIPGGGTCTEGASRPCGSDAGTCKPGTQSCTAGTWAACAGAVGPVSETCDGKDNDCDGTADDNLTDAPACDKTQGVCADAKAKCTGGQYDTPCTAADYGALYEAVEVTCDGKDNDCDGTADESVTGGTCPNAGVCAGYDKACTGGAPGACQAPGFEATETSCDGKDNNCNGQVDEGIVSATACALTQGVCANRFAACVDGGFEASCSAASYGQSFEPAEQTCDGKDNDCNGSVDRLADGGLIRASACELTLGVCASVGRACVAGNFEAPCTAASYGSSFQSSEFTCDGLDNDCDGVVDRSNEAGLVVTPNALTTHLDLVSDDQEGMLAIYVDQRAGVPTVFVQRFTGELKPVGNELQLSDAATESRVPTLARAGAGYVAAWVEKLNGGAERIMLGRLAPDFTLDWKKVVVSPASFYKAPRLATTATVAVVAWIESNGLVVNAAAYDFTGQNVTPATVLTTPKDAGVEMVFDMDVMGRPNGTEIVLGWAALVSGSSGPQNVRFKAFTTALAPSTTLREVTFPSETAGGVRLARFGQSGELAGAWIGSVGSSSASIRWVANALQTSSPPQVAASASGQIFDLALAETSTAAVGAWIEGTSPGRLSVLDLGSDAGVQNLTPSGATSVFGPEFGTRADGGALTIGYECDRGTGLDLYARSLCPR